MLAQHHSPIHPRWWQWAPPRANANKIYRLKAITAIWWSRLFSAAGRFSSLTTISPSSSTFESNHISNSKGRERNFEDVSEPFLSPVSLSLSLSLSLPALWSPTWLWCDFWCQQRKKKISSGRVSPSSSSSSHHHSPFSLNSLSFLNSPPTTTSNDNNTSRSRADCPERGNTRVSQVVIPNSRKMSKISHCWKVKVGESSGNYTTKLFLIHSSSSSEY